MSIVIYFSLIYPLWNQDYVNMTLQSWEKGPITELREISSTADCDQSTLEAAIKADGDTVSGLISSGTYEIVGQGYWWGILNGCICPTGSDWANADDIICTDNMTTMGCSNIPVTDLIQKMPIVNSKQLCAFRDTTYNYVT